VIRRLAALALASSSLLTACNSAPSEPTVSVKTIPGHDALPEDTSTKEAPRLMLAETYVRSYLQIFGGLAPLTPLEAQAAARGKDGSALFDTWNDYLLALGFPDYRIDIPRQGAPNAVMVAAFERVGVALCDRALENDWKATPATPADKRLVFAFDMPTGGAAGALDKATFAPGFDVLHRTFLGYPAALAQTDRASRFLDVYNGVVAAHAAPGSPTSRFTPAEAGWAAVCYGLVRHPEFHLY
jgi:hypothetical protein